MSEKQITYVVDTNVLVDYIDIIPGGEMSQPEEPTIDLKEAHIVIPTAVVRELSSFKKEKSDRGKAARVLLDRLRALTKGKVQTMADAYGLEKPITITKGGQKLSVLPIHKNFKKSLPFSPSESDMDGQIILATLTIAALNAGLPIDGTADVEEMMKLKPADIVLLTNDNGLAIRARVRGLMTSRYGYKYPEPYTGRRDITVPKELLDEFLNERIIERVLFEAALPSERKLVANEFVVMYPDEDPRLCGVEDEYEYFANIGRYDANDDAIVPLRYISDFPTDIKTAGQAIYAEALMDPDISAVICSGPAGSGKTYMATVYGYQACKSGAFIGVTAVPCESHSKIGALPGDLDEKMDPEIQPLKNALRNYLLTEDSKLRKELKALQKFGVPTKGKRDNGIEDEPPDKRSIKTKLKDRVDMIWENWFSSIPIENARGRDFAFELAIYDEFQDQNIPQADTLIKRIGTGGKIILTGDIYQIHAPYLDEFNNGLVYASRLLYDNPLVAQVCFTEEEVVRHPLVKMIAKRQTSNGRRNGKKIDE
ncbi:PhoH family protein [Candidatus Saccharibacteria bacterium]|nr:PhoH family protein [Candidatus Saccharibacteria bacterium]